MNIYPTLVELAALPTKAGLDGKSLVPLLKNPDAAWERPAVMTWLRGNHAVRTGRWRYIRYADGAEELYDHTQDPWEWKNLADDPELEDVRQVAGRRRAERHVQGGTATLAARGSNAAERQGGTKGNQANFGRARPIAKARLKIGGFDRAIDCPPDSTMASFSVPLQAGKTTVETFFLNDKDEVLCSAFYTQVKLTDQ